MSGNARMHAEQFLRRTARNLAASIDDANEELAERAAARAPSRKPERRKHDRFKVTAIAIGGYTGDVNAKSGDELLRLAQQGKVFLQASGSRKTVSPRERYAIATGQIGGLRRTSRGLYAHIGGTLKKSIHAIHAVIEGDVVRGTVRAEAPYAMPMERGFTHVGGKHVPGRKFLRTALAEVGGQLVRGDYW